MTAAAVPSQDDLTAVVLGAQRYGGGFAKVLLGQALPLADPQNQARIRLAFPEMWTKYQGLGVLAAADDKRKADEAGA